MELYFKDLISEEASLDKLAEDLERVMHGADDFAKAVGLSASEQTHREIAHRAFRLQENCRKVRDQIIAGAEATDQLVRKRPYAALLVVFGAGLLLGAIALRKK